MLLLCSVGARFLGCLRMGQFGSPSQQAWVGVPVHLSLFVGSPFRSDFPMISSTDATNNQSSTFFEDLHQKRANCQPPENRTSSVLFFFMFPFRTARYHKVVGLAGAALRAGPDLTGHLHPCPGSGGFFGLGGEPKSPGWRT